MSKTFLFQAIQFSLIVLIQINQFSISIVFVYTLLNVKTGLFQTIHFSISIQFKYQNSSISSNLVQHKYTVQFCLIHRTLSGATTLGPEWTWKWWQWRGTRHSLKLQHYWSLTIRLLCVISRTLVGRGSYPSAELQSVYSTAPANWAKQMKEFSLKIIWVYTLKKINSPWS